MWKNGVSDLGSFCDINVYLFDSKEPTLEDRSDAPPLRMRAENGMRNSKNGRNSSTSSRKLKYRAKKAKEEKGGIGNRVDHTVAPMQQLQVAETATLASTAASSCHRTWLPL